MLARAAPHRLLALRPLPLLPRAPFAGLAAASAPRTLCTSRTRSSAAPHSETPLSANTSASASTSTSTPTHAPVPASAPTPTPTPPPPPPAPKPKKGFFRRTFNVLVWAVVLTAAGVTWKLYDARHPPQQLPHDPSKKTIVVLGSGWASTSFLKHLDTDQFNVVVISPHNYFLFTPLLPSVPTGTLQARSIAQPTRMTTRFLPREVQVIEAEAEKVDVENKTVTFEYKSDDGISNPMGKVTIGFDYLIYGVGSENQTFGIQGVKDHACFLKELPDADKIRNKLMDAVEAASIKGTPEQDVERLLHMIVVGGGPTGVEYAAELRDFVTSDLSKWFPEVAGKVRVTLIEALPSILPSFSKRLIEYTNSTFKEIGIELKLKHMVKDVDEEFVYVQSTDGSLQKIPYGVLVWAAGNTLRPVTRDVIAQLADSQHNRRGLEIDAHLRLKGAESSIFAAGDATASQYAPTGQVASQQGAYLARVINKIGRVEALREKLGEVEARPLSNESRAEILALQKQITKAEKIRPFEYTHQGSLAYVGRDRAIADIPFLGGEFASSGVATYIFWKSAYMSLLFSLRQRLLVAWDWTSVAMFGRDVTRE